MKNKLIMKYFLKLVVYVELIAVFTYGCIWVAFWFINKISFLVTPPPLVVLPIVMGIAFFACFIGLAVSFIEDWVDGL